MPSPRYWIPEPVTPETIIYRRCYRCGIDVEPKAGQRRQCRDCYELQIYKQQDTHHDQVREMLNNGTSQRQIAHQLGISRTTANKWARAIRRAEGVLV